MDAGRVNYLADKILERYEEPNEALDYCLQQQESFASIGNSVGLQLWQQVQYALETLGADRG